MRPLGRRLTSLVSEYLTRGSNRDNLLDEARDIAHEYGGLLVRDGLGLKDTVAAFTFFRKGLDETAMEEAQKSELTADKAMELWELLSNLADQVLLSIAETYDEAKMVRGPPLARGITQGVCATTRSSSISPVSRSLSSAAAISRTRRWRTCIKAGAAGDSHQPRSE